MFACLYGSSARLAELADQFSPLVEKAGDGVVVFSIDGLTSLFFGPLPLIFFQCTEGLFLYRQEHFRQGIAAHHDFVAEKENEQPNGRAKKVQEGAKTLPACLSRIVKNRLGHADKPSLS